MEPRRLPDNMREFRADDLHELNMGGGGPRVGADPLIWSDG